MKQNYTLDKKTSNSSPGSKRLRKGQPGSPGRKQSPIRFKDLNDIPSKVRFRSRPDGFLIRTPGPNYGKAMAMFATILVPGFIFIYGPAAEQADPFQTRMITGIIIGIFFLAGMYCLLRKHELLVKGDSFRLSSGIGILSLRQKGTLSNIKSMWVQGKLRRAPHATSYRWYLGGSQFEESHHRSYYLGLGLKSGPSIHALEGGNRIALHYFAFALQAAISGRKQ